MNTAIKKRKKIQVFDVINVLLIGVVLLTVIYPLYFIVIASISDPNMVNSGQVILFPKGITFEGYERAPLLIEAIKAAKAAK